jgi:cell division topological specificity factor
MIDWFRKVFSPEPSSSSAAKERLRLVLMTDHLSMAPEMIEAMKRDLVDVISRYVEVDRQKIEVNFEQQDKALAMLANIPIISVNRPAGGDTAGGGSTGAPAAPVEAAPPSPATVEMTGAPESAAPPAAPPVRSRRRRRKASGTIPAPAKPATAH